MERKFIFQDWVAIELSKRGFTCVSRPDLKNPMRTVYIYIKTPQLIAALSDILSVK